MDMRGLDEWITGGRYSQALGYVTCRGCGEQTPVVSETEYGASTWEPEECCKCGKAWDGDEDWEDDEGPDPDIAYDRSREEF